MRAVPRRRAVVLAVLPALLGPVAAARAQDRPALRAQLAGAMAGAPAASGAYAEDLDSGTPLFSSRATVARVPASVQKLYTASTALVRLGPDDRLATTVAGRGALLPDGTFQGDLVLRGGGDPTLSNAGLATLARQVAGKGVLRVQGAILGDESFFDALRGGPRTGFRYDGDVGGVLGALTVGRGWSRSGSPAAEASRRFAAALKAERITVGGTPASGGAAPETDPLAMVTSPTIAELARATLVPSDNFIAETLLKDVGARTGAGGTTTAGAAVVREEAADFGLAPRVADGSGLSRANRTSPMQVVGLLKAMRERPEGQALQAALPVVGRSGTVRRRMRGTVAQGRCRAKTGTLSDVSALAGVCTTPAGRTVGFAMLMNRTSVWRAHRVQDRITVALARYSG